MNKTESMEFKQFSGNINIPGKLTPQNTKYTDLPGLIPPVLPILPLAELALNKYIYKQETQNL